MIAGLTCSSTTRRSSPGGTRRARLSLFSQAAGPSAQRLRNISKHLVRHWTSKEPSKVCPTDAQPGGMLSAAAALLPPAGLLAHLK